MTVTVEPQVDEPAPSRPRRRRLRATWIALGVVLVLASAGAITGTVWYRHYADAARLTVDGGEFYPITGGHGGYRDVQIGAVDVAGIQVRRATEQGFVLDVYNPSSVTQTILGTPHSPGPSAEHDRVLVSTSDPNRFGAQVTFAPGPGAVPPGQYRAVKYLTRTSVCWHAGRSETYTALHLRVRVGGTVRTEVVPFTSLITVVIEARHATC